jgi:hypothetical protein
MDKQELRQRRTVRGAKAVLNDRKTAEKINSINF